MEENNRTPVIGDLYINTMVAEQFNHLMMVYDFDKTKEELPNGAGYLIRFVYCESIRQAPRPGCTNEYNYNIKIYSSSSLALVLIKHINEVTFTDRIQYSWKIEALEQWCDENGVKRQ